MTEPNSKPQATQTIEGVKLLADWAKWLVTLETTVMVVVTFVSTMQDPYTRGMMRVCAAAAVGSFAVSIIAATLLLRSLPGIMQEIEPDQKIWKTEDTSRLKLGWNTLALVKIQSIFFGIGLLLITAIMILKIMG